MWPPFPVSYSSSTCNFALCMPVHFQAVRKTKRYSRIIPYIRQIFGMSNVLQVPKVMLVVNIRISQLLYPSNR